MSTKLTLTIEKDVIQKAKKYARKKNRSLSDIIENYLKTLTSREKLPDDHSGQIVNSLRGSFKMPEGFDYKKELQNELEKKHLS